MKIQNETLDGFLTIGKNSNRITLVNPSDRDWTRSRYILHVGPYGWSKYMVWANCLGDALDEVVDHLAENSPGMLYDDQVAEEYNRCIAMGMPEEEAIELAESDMMVAGNCGNYIASWEWGILAENPTRDELLELTELWKGPGV